MNFETRPDCNLNLKNVKFKIGQKYHLMKLSYSKGFTNLAELYNVFDYRVLPAHHHYILIDTIGNDNKKCFTSIGLIKKIIVLYHDKYFIAKFAFKLDKRASIDTIN